MALQYRHALFSELLVSFSELACYLVLQWSTPFQSRSYGLQSWTERACWPFSLKIHVGFMATAPLRRVVEYVTITQVWFVALWWRHVVLGLGIRVVNAVLEITFGFLGNMSHTSLVNTNRFAVVSESCSFHPRACSDTSQYVSGHAHNPWPTRPITWHTNEEMTCSSFNRAQDGRTYYWRIQVGWLSCNTLSTTTSRHLGIFPIIFSGGFMCDPS